MGFPSAAKQARRLSGQRGGAARRGVWVALDIDLSSEEATDSDARAAYCRAEKISGEKRRAEGNAMKNTSKIKGGGQTFYGFKG